MRFPNPTLLLLLTSLIFSSAGQAQELSKAASNLINHPGLQGASIALHVMDLETGATYMAHQENQALIPASTQKLITTGVALDVLGAEASFRTRLAIEGNVENGILEGNVFIIGGGDPTLASTNLANNRSGDRILSDWIAAIQAAGIRQIQGYVIADDSYFSTAGIAMGWPWADLGNYYGVGTYGLNWHENYYYLDFVQRQKLGTIPPVQQTRPQIPGLTLHNEVRTAARGSGDNAYIYGAPFNFTNYLRGTIPAGSGRFTIKGAIPDPPLFVAQSLEKALNNAGISVLHPAASSRALGTTYSGGGEILHEHRSPPMRDIVDRTNLRSVNFYAETLLREINKSRGVPQQDLSGTEALIDYLSGELGLNTNSIRLEDGSGLATRNFFPPSFMTAFLRTQADQPTFLNSIPLAGRTGSMRNRLKGTKAEGRLYAKSGSVNSVRCYAGYAFPASGRRLAFAVMVNNYTLEGRELSRLLYAFMEQLCE